MKWILSLLLLFGCATHRPRLYPKAPPVLWNHLIYFEDTFGISVDHLTVKIEELPLEFMMFRAYCTPSKGEIVFNKFFYDDAHPIQVKATMVHELAHCAMFLGHIAEAIHDRCDWTIMATSTPNVKCLQQNWDYYMKQLDFIFDHYHDAFGIRGFKKPVRNLRSQQ